jgi:lipopolysaccharide heptosyltransferase II
LLNFAEKIIVHLDKAEKILVIRLSSLGDILLSTPLLRSIKKTFPSLKIDYLIKEEYVDLLTNNSNISRIYIYKKKKTSELVKQLKSEGYDYIIDLQNNLRSTTIVSKIGTPSSSFNKRNIKKFLLVNIKINSLRDAPPIPERYFESTRNLLPDDEGLELVTFNKPSLQITNEDKLIGFAPGARHFTKMWEKQYYAKLGNLLQENNFKVALFGGRSDLELCKEISSLIPGAINLCNDNNILQTAADMKKCLAVVCNDSGLMHTACAVKIPVLVFFGSTVKEFGFAPYKNKNSILENKYLSCRPCSHIGRSSCPKGHFKCMLEITPEIAFKNLLLLLNS